MFLGPVLLCTCLWLPRKQQRLLLVLQQDWAGKFPGKLHVAQKPQPKLRILLAFPKGYMAARGMWSPGNSGSDQLHVAGCQPLRLTFLVNGLVMGLSLEPSSLGSQQRYPIESVLRGDGLS